MQDSSLPLSCWKQEEVYIWYLLWESGQAPGGTSHTIVENSPVTSYPCSFYLSELSILSAQQFLHYS